MISRDITTWIKFGVVLVAIFIGIGCGFQTQCRNVAAAFWHEEARPAMERWAAIIQGKSHDVKMWFKQTARQEERRAKSLEEGAKGIQERNKELQKLSNEGIKEFIKE